MTSETELQKAATAAVKEAEDAFVRAMFVAGLTMSPSVDKVATWLLVGIGATLGLIVANLDGTSAFIGANETRTVLLILLVAGLIGLLQKVMAVRVGFLVHADEKLRFELPQILDRLGSTVERIRKQATGIGMHLHTEDIDRDRILRELDSIVPWYSRKFVRTSVQKSLLDPLHGFKDAGRMFNRQAMYAVLELLLVVAAVLYVAMNVGQP